MSVIKYQGITSYKKSNKFLNGSMMKRNIRIFYPEALTPGATISLSEFSSHHLLRVLRLQVGAALILFNGSGGEYQSRLIEMRKNQAVVLIGEWQDPQTESKLHIHLGQGISRGERMDYAIQKSVELGVFAITPIMTERSEVKFSKESLQRRLQHWQQIAISAGEQSGRCSIPVIHAPQLLKDWIMQAQGITLICDPHVAAAHIATLKKEIPIHLLIGAEGGFTDGEVKQAIAQGFQSFSLGPRILRTETAPVVALTLLQSLLGTF